jgi:folylpolyglutamate synthase/dihydropteroate synthase
MATTTYKEILQRLFVTNSNKFVTYGLGNMGRLHSALGNPMETFHVVHVAGTNGKGSVCHKVAKALEHAGHRTGLFTSPHNTCFRERAAVNGQMITEAEVSKTKNTCSFPERRFNSPSGSFRSSTCYRTYGILQRWRILTHHSSSVQLLCLSRISQSRSATSLCWRLG